MRKIYVDVTARLLLKVDEDAKYDDVAGELEEELTACLESVSLSDGEIEILEPVKIEVSDSK